MLYRIDDDDKGIALIGTQTKIFFNSPSCFGLMINNLAIFSYSKDFILGKTLGFPFPEKYAYVNDMMIKIDGISPGSNKITTPLMHGRIFKPAVKFYQSILKGPHDLKRPQIGPGRIYIADNCLTFTNDEITSRIFISDEHKTTHKFWLMNETYRFEFPEKKFDRDGMHICLAKMVLEHQIQSVEDVSPRLEIADEQEKNETIAFFNKIISDNRTLLTGIDAVVNPLTINI